MIWCCWKDMCLMRDHSVLCLSLPQETEWERIFGMGIKKSTDLRSDHLRINYKSLKTETGISASKDFKTWRIDSGSRSSGWVLKLERWVRGYSLSDNKTDKLQVLFSLRVFTFFFVSDQVTWFGRHWGKKSAKNHSRSCIFIFFNWIELNSLVLLL